LIIKSLNTANGRIIISYEEPISNEKKRVFEKRVIYKLISILDIQPADLHYGERGNPELLTSPLNISISHSKGWFAVYIGNSAIGIDIQDQKSNISKAKSFFLNKHEIQWSTDIDLHLIWSSKEVIYKILKGDVEDVMINVIILEIDHLNHKIKAQYIDSKFDLFFDLFDSVILVYN